MFPEILFCGDTNIPTTRVGYYRGTFPANLRKKHLDSELHRRQPCGHINIPTERLSVNQLFGDTTRMTFPALSPGEFALAQAEVDTGIVLGIEGKRHLGADEIYRVFGSLDAARAYAHQVVAASQRVECHVYDADQVHIERIAAS